MRGEGLERQKCHSGQRYARGWGGWKGSGVDLPPNVIRHHYVCCNCVRILALTGTFLTLSIKIWTPCLSSKTDAGVERSTQAWFKPDGIGLDSCFINMEETWHYVIAAVPVLISDFRHSGWDIFFSPMFICLQLNELALGHAHQVIFNMFKGAWPEIPMRLFTNTTVTTAIKLKLRFGNYVIRC